MNKNINLKEFNYKLLNLPNNKNEIIEYCKIFNLNINNIINSIIKYPNYNTQELDIKKYIDIFKYFNNILFYQNKELKIKDIEYLNNYNNYKDIRYILQVLNTMIDIKGMNYINISYNIPFYKYQELPIMPIYKEDKIVRIKGYQLKKHSFFDNNMNLFIIFQCYVISSINMILQNKDLQDVLVYNDLSVSLESINNLKYGGMIEINLPNYSNNMINVFQHILIHPQSNNLKIIKSELNKITKNKYLLGISPIKLYPHILVNDLLKSLGNIQFVNDCKIIYYNNTFQYIFDLEINKKYINFIQNNQTSIFNISPYNLYDVFINDPKYKNIKILPKHLYISSICNDVSIYTIYGISNDCINNIETKIIKKNLKKTNIFPINMTFSSYFIFNTYYKLNKFIVYNTQSHHFTVYKFRNDILIRLDGKNNINVEIINNIEDAWMFDKYSIYMKDNNIYDIVGLYKIVLLQYDKI